MVRHLASLMFGVMNAVENQLSGVGAVEPVVDAVAFAPGLNESSKTQFREVLGD